MPRKVSQDTTESDRRQQSTEPDADGQSGYGAGDGVLDGAGAWSGRANPKTASPGTRAKPKTSSVATKRGRKR